MPNLDAPEKMPKITFSEDGIAKLLRKIKSDKSPEDAQARVLKEVAVSVAPFLKIVFEISVSEGRVPNDWKIANVTPIFKSGEKDDPSNYRSISLTSPDGKVMEHIIVGP